MRRGSGAWLGSAAAHRARRGRWLAAGGRRRAPTLREALVDDLSDQPAPGGGPLRAAPGRRAGAAGAVRLPAEPVPQRRRSTGERSTASIQRRRTSPSQNRIAKSVNLTLRQNLYAGGGTAGAGQPGREPGPGPARPALRARAAGPARRGRRLHRGLPRPGRARSGPQQRGAPAAGSCEATRDRFEVGEVARTDVAQAEARLSRARADVEQAKADLASSRAFYERVVGEAPSKLEEPKVLPGAAQDRDETPAPSPTQQPRHHRRHLRPVRRARRRRRQLLQPAAQPRSAGSGSSTPTSRPRSIEWERTASLGLKLSIPLYQGGGRVFAGAREPPAGAPAARPARDRPPQRPGAGRPPPGSGCWPPPPRSTPSRPRCAPTRSRSRASSRRRWSARAPCSTCSTPSRSCSPRRSTSSAPAARRSWPATS